MEQIMQGTGRHFQNSAFSLRVDLLSLFQEAVSGKSWILKLALLVTLFSSQPALSQGDPGTEYKFKSVYLYNLLQFVEWPEESFQQHSSPLVIVILGQDPFGQVLDQTVRNEKVQNHEIVVRRYGHVDEIKECHLLFMGRSEKDHFFQVLRKMENRSVLTVSEVEGFVEHGGAINFYIEKNKLRFEVNTEALKKAGLKVSSKLLRLAKVVTRDSVE